MLLASHCTSDFFVKLGILTFKCLLLQIYSAGSNLLDSLCLQCLVFFNLLLHSIDHPKGYLNLATQAHNPNRSVRRTTKVNLAEVIRNQYIKIIGQGDTQNAGNPYPDQNSDHQACTGKMNLHLMRKSNKKNTKPRSATRTILRSTQKQLN